MRKIMATPKNYGHPINSSSFAGALGPNPVVLVRQTGAMRDLNGEFYNETNVMMAIRQVLVRDDGQTRYDLASLEDIIYEHGDWLNFPLRIRELDDRHGMNPMNARMGDIIIIADTRNGYNAVHEATPFP